MNKFSGLSNYSAIDTTANILHPGLHQETHHKDESHSPSLSQSLRENR